MARRNPIPAPREAMTETEAARACASMFVRDGISEGTGPGEFEITDVSIDGDGRHLVTMIVRVANLDIEAATAGHHLHQAEINTLNLARRLRVDVDNMRGQPRHSSRR